jgi:hypothetical protein
LGLRSDAHKEDLIKNKKMKSRRNLDMNVEATPLAHVKVEIEQGQDSRLRLGLNAEKEDLIRNNELRNRGNLDLNVEAPHLIHVKVKIE